MRPPGNPATGAWTDIIDDEGDMGKAGSRDRRPDIGPLAAGYREDEFNPQTSCWRHRATDRVTNCHRSGAPSSASLPLRHE
jgi:hypothetical protein